MSLGSLLGALTAASRVGPTRRMLIGSGAAFGALTLLAAVAPVAGCWWAPSWWPSGVAIMLFLATANTTLQLASDPAMRGRVMALYGLVFLGSTPLGGPVPGLDLGPVGRPLGPGRQRRRQPGRGPRGRRPASVPPPARGPEVALVSADARVDAAADHAA